MLAISATQMELLRQAAVEAFVSRTLHHVEAHFSTHRQIIGEAQMRAVIRLAVERAGRHGFTTERDVSLYLNLMLLLGSAFDADAQLPWAAQILSDAELTDPQERIDRLYDAAVDYLEKVAGARNEHPEPARERMVAAIQRKVPAVPASDFGNLALSVLRWICPRKFEVAGGGAIRVFARQSLQAAQVYGVLSHDSALLYLAMAYMLGGGFDRDPQYPWAGSILLGASAADAAGRFERLRKTAVSELSRWTARAG